MLRDDDWKILQASSSDASIFTQYYFDIDMLPHQLVAAHARQHTLLTLGGRASGKTFGYILAGIWMATLMPDFRMLWTSFTADQSAIAFNDIKPIVLQSERFARFLPEGANSFKKGAYPEIHIQIPGQPESVIRFVTSDASSGGDRRRGYQWDWIHIDEGGLIMDNGETVNTLRPSLRGRRNVRGRPPRLGRISTSTTPTAAPWLRDWWDKAKSPDYPEYNPDEYWAIRVSSDQNTTLTEQQLRSFQSDMSEEEIKVELQGEFPEYMGNEFSPTIVNACEDRMLNKEVDDMIADGVPDARMDLLGRYGIYRYQKPVIDGRKYVLVGDPGTGNPPYRNAGVILVWDVTEVPYELVYFHWVSGGGDYRPFFNDFEWAYRYYNPVYTAFDATGTQRAMDQLYFENKGLVVEGLSVTTEKSAMINTLKILLQRKLLRFPHLHGMRLQLLGYKQEEDKKLPQDIVMAMAMAAWRMRSLFYIDPKDIGEGEEFEPTSMNRHTRTRNRVVGRR